MASIIQNMATAFVTTQFDQSAQDYKSSPSPQNWQELKTAMDVLQAWHEINRPGVDIDSLLIRLGTVGISQWNQLISEFACPSKRDQA